MSESANTRAGIAPRCTVLVVGHNHAPYVETCLRSVRGQSVPVRTIVIDDGSSDGTAERARAVDAELDLGSTLIRHQRARGLPAGLAEGLDLVETEFFCYLAADDFMTENRVSRQLEAFDTEGDRCALVYSDATRCGEADDLYPELFSEMHADVWNPHSGDVFRDLLTSNWIPAPTIMIRTQALRDAGGYDESIFYEDHDVCLRLARSHDLVCVDEPLATHRELANALGRKFFAPEYRDEWLAARIRVLEKHLGFRDNCNALIAELILELTWQRYLAGSAGPRETDSVLARLSPHVSVAQKRLLTRSRVPGPLYRRARRLSTARGGRRSHHLIP